MRKIFYVLVPLVTLFSLRQAEAVIIDATAIGNSTSMTLFVDSGGQEVYFSQGSGGQNVVITSGNSSENLGQTYSLGQEFGLSAAPAQYPGVTAPVADIWINLQLGLDLSTFLGTDDINHAMLGVTPGNRESILRVDFENTVSNVEIEFVVFPGAFNDPGDVDGNNSTFGFYAFNSDGDLIGRMTSTNDASPTQFPVLMSAFVGVKTLLIGANAGSIVPIGVRSISYNIEETPPPPAVPEPASAALALFGLAGAFLGHRRLMAAA